MSIRAELDDQGQPTQRTLNERRQAKYVTPIPKPKKQKKDQRSLDLGDGLGLSSEGQQYEETASRITEVRFYVDQWRKLPESSWGVTPETARLLKHWRHHPFSHLRPFFCQVEAVETAIWLTRSLHTPRPPQSSWRETSNGPAGAAIPACSASH